MNGIRLSSPDVVTLYRSPWVIWVWKEDRIATAEKSAISQAFEAGTPDPMIAVFADSSREAVVTCCAPIADGPKDRPDMPRYPVAASAASPKTMAATALGPTRV